MNRPFISYHKHLTFYAICFLIFHIIRVTNGLTLTGLSDPFLHEVRQDPLIWLYTFTGIPDGIIATNFIPVFLDVLVAIPVVCLLFFRLSPKLRRVVILLHLFLFSAYLLTIFVFPSLSIRKYLGLAIVPLVFLFTKEEHYQKAMSYLRYYVLFIFSSSALWKLGRGAIFEGDQFVNILRNQHLEHIVLFPDHITTHVAIWLIAHPSVSFVFYLAIAVLQLSFIIGFFTRRCDRLLLAAMLLFILGDFLVMRVEYWEFLVFIFLLAQKSCAPSAGEPKTCAPAGGKGPFSKAFACGDQELILLLKMLLDTLISIIKFCLPCHSSHNSE